MKLLNNLAANGLRGFRKVTNSVCGLKSIIFITLITGACQMKPQHETYDYPRPEKKEKVFTNHGYKREDPYYWLKERENPKVVDYLTKENAQAEKFFQKHSDIIDEVYNQLKSRTADNENSAPIIKGAYTYWSRYQAGLEQPQHVRKHTGSQEAETVILDENELAKGHDFMECAGPYISPKQDWIAYSVDTQGRRFYDIHFKNLTTGKVADFSIKSVTGNLTWAQDNETIFYSRQDPNTLRSYQVYRYNIKTHKNELVYEEKDPEFNVGVSKSLSEKFIFMSINHLQTAEVRYIHADQPKSEFKVFRPRIKGVSDTLVDGGDSFYLVTDENAPNQKIYRVPYDARSKKDWKEFLPHRSDIFIADVDAVRGYLIVTERKDGLNQIRVIDEKTNDSRYVTFEDPSYSVGTSMTGMFDRGEFRIVYESMRVPEKTIDISLKDMSQKLVKQHSVPNFNTDNYRTERVWITARDGQKVPVSLVMKKDYKPNGKNPLFQYGYGSYGYAIPPYFMLTALTLVDRGFVFAIAHIRGGDDLGRTWYDQGRMQNKMNTFTDFIDVTEGLLQKGYGQKGHVYARGGSAGGLLMGAVANMRPDLYNGMIAEVPFVDILTTMLDDSIPLTTGEYEEWGNPRIKEQYDWMAKYSPYDNVKRQAYPNMLIRTGFHDSQVQYWEPAKWTARLRDLNTSDSLILLSVDMEAGHGGVTGRYKQLKEQAESLSFPLALEGEK
jgi:oligopeptidase B